MSNFSQEHYKNLVTRRLRLCGATSVFCLIAALPIFVSDLFLLDKYQIEQKQLEQFELLFYGMTLLLEIIGLLGYIKIRK